MPQDVGAAAGRAGFGMRSPQRVRPWVAFLGPNPLRAQSCQAGSLTRHDGTDGLPGLLGPACLMQILPEV